MKKVFVLIMASLLCASINAQDRGFRSNNQRRTLDNNPRGFDSKDEDDKKHTFFLGIKGGVDFTSMTQPDECDLYDGSGTGFSGGIVAKARFGKANKDADPGTGIWGAGIEIKYKKNTVKTIGTDEAGNTNADLTVNYFEVPIYAQVYPFYKSDAMNTFYIELGPDFAGTLSREPKSLTADNLTGEYSSVTYNFDTDNSTLKGMDIRLMAGVGYDFPLKNSNHETKSLIGLNARYYLGTSELAGNFKSKMNTFEVSVSWMFNIGKL